VPKSYRQVTDRTLGDVQAANDALWKDVRHPPEGGQQVAVRGKVVAQHDDEEDARTLDPNIANKSEDEEKKDTGAWRGSGATGEYRGRPAKLQKRLDKLREMQSAVKKDQEGRESLGGEAKDRAVHLPRRASRTWRRREWS
jgi:hypothetical protein